mmetsp:Transcript_15747/g.59707  ORF Transcript_15747/g.59707 Transcript_15747/m.59707 type:complete len:203 (+) Transcript_15747:930-1538(+)
MVARAASASRLARLASAQRSRISPSCWPKDVCSSCHSVVCLSQPRRSDTRRSRSALRSRVRALMRSWDSASTRASRAWASASCCSSDTRARCISTRRERRLVPSSRHVWRTPSKLSAVSTPEREPADAGVAMGGDPVTPVNMPEWAGLPRREPWDGAPRPAPLGARAEAASPPAALPRRSSARSSSGLTVALPSGDAGCTGE